MINEGVGEGLEGCIQEPKWNGSRNGKGLATLASTSRLSIFSFVCKSPCTSLSYLVDRTSLAPSTLRWHLRVLENIGLISTRQIAGRSVYYPNRVFGSAALFLMARLRSRNVPEIFHLVLENPGISQKELLLHLPISQQALSSLTRGLEKYGILSSVVDGRAKRYFLGKTVMEMKKENGTGSLASQKAFMNNLRSLGVDFEIIQRDDDKLTLELRLPLKTEIMTIVTNPLRAAV